jgi:hypothetical protein
VERGKRNEESWGENAFFLRNIWSIGKIAVPLHPQN